jgi:hypothetical protein
MGVTVVKPSHPFFARTPLQAAPTAGVPGMFRIIATNRDCHSDPELAEGEESAFSSAQEKADSSRQSPALGMTNFERLGRASQQLAAF